MRDGVTVVIPTWNRAATLAQSIQSVLDQTVAPLEVLVCDDGSNDNSEQVVRSVTSASVHWVPGARGGRPAIPRNRGISQSRGEWIAFLDSDDEWRPHKLERQLAVARELNSKAICSNAVRYIPTQGTAGPLLTWSKKRACFRDILEVNQVICSSVLLHRSLLPAIEGFPEDVELKALEDYALWLRVAALTDFAYIDEPLVVYRDDPNGSVRADGVDVVEQKKRVLKNFLSWAVRHRTRNVPLYAVLASKSIVRARIHKILRKIRAGAARVRSIIAKC